MDHFKLNRNIEHKYIELDGCRMVARRESFTAKWTRDEAPAERSKNDLVALCENSICDW